MNQEWDRWELVNGTAQFDQGHGSFGDLLQWFTVQDENDTLWGENNSRVRASTTATDGNGGSYWNTTSSTYVLHVELERDQEYVAPGETAPNPGMIGVTFGEQPGSGYYAVAFDNDRFILGTPNATTDSFDIEVDLPYWGNVDERKQNVDVPHLYTIIVNGTTVTVRVDNHFLGSYTVGGVPAGTFGFGAAPDTRVRSLNFEWQPLDTTSPTIDIHRPAEGNLYVADIDIPYGETGPIFVVGDLTIGADFTDDISGMEQADLWLDGRRVTSRDNPTQEFWTIATDDLSPGYHTVMIRAHDYASNSAEAEVTFYVLGAGFPDGGTASDTLDAAGQLLPV